MHRKIVLIKAGMHISLKSGSDVKILDARMMICRNFCTDEPQISGIMMPNLGATVTWRPEFVHPWVNVTETRPVD